MKVTVTKYLNVRVGEPSVNAPNYQYLAPGSILEIDGKVYKGDTYEGNNKWYKDEAGNYYWSGGVDKPDEHIKHDVAIDNQIDYRKLIKLKGFPFRKINIHSRSEMSIAVLDSGIYYKHPDFGNTSTFLLSSNNEPIDHDKNYIDKYNHGTKVAGIIGARNQETIGINGLCPDCSILSIKTLNDLGFSNSVLVKDSLTELGKHPKIKLANLSFSISNNAYSKISSILNQLAIKKILVAAAGNEEILTSDGSSSNVRIIARNPNIISVAAIPIEELLKSTIKLPQAVDYVIPKLKMVSTSNDPNTLYGDCIGSSFAAPLITGLLAELMIINSNLNNRIKVLSKLNEYCYTLEEFKAQFNNIKTYKNGIPVIKNH